MQLLGAPPSYRGSDNRQQNARQGERSRSVAPRLRNVQCPSGKRSAAARASASGGREGGAAVTSQVRSDTTRIGPPNRREANRNLVKAVIEQARRDAFPPLWQLVSPWLEGPPKPLTGTVPPSELADPDSKLMDVGGIRVHYKEEVGPSGSSASSPSAAPFGLVCLHGFNGSVFSYRSVLGPLASSFPGPESIRVIAFDRPPFGLTSRPLTWDAGQPNPYSTEGYVKLTLGLLDALGLRPGAGGPSAIGRNGEELAGRVVILGHSAGAQVALQVALAAPERVAGVVLVSPAIPASEAKEDSFLGKADFGTLMRILWLRYTLSQDGPGLNYITRRIEELRRTLDLDYGSGERAPREVVEGYLAPSRADGWDEGLLRLFRNFEAPRPPPTAEECQWPILIVQGEKDVVTRAENSRKLAARLGSGCTYVELPGIGHLPMDEDPKAFVAAVEPFLAWALHREQQGEGSDFRVGNTEGAAAGSGGVASRG